MIEQITKDCLKKNHTCMTIYSDGAIYYTGKAVFHALEPMAAHWYFQPTFQPHYYKTGGVIYSDGAIYYTGKAVLSATFQPIFQPHHTPATHNIDVRKNKLIKMLKYIIKLLKITNKKDT